MLSFFTRLFKEADDAASERLKMPIVPLYLSLLAFSYWRPLSIFLLSKNTIEQKISLIDKLYLNWSFWDHIWVVISMLVLASLSSALFPLLMWLLDWILLTPIGKRKFYNNETKKLDMLTDLQATQHKYEKNKILSGNKEVEDYNKSIDDLTKSYEDRIKSLENVSMQKELNWEKEKAVLENQYQHTSEANNSLQQKLITVERRIEQLLEERQESGNFNLELNATTVDITSYTYLGIYPEVLGKLVSDKVVKSKFSEQELRFISDVLRAKDLTFYRKLRSVLLTSKISHFSLDVNQEGGKFIQDILLEYNIGKLVSKLHSIEEYSISDNNRQILRLYEFLNLVSRMLPQFT